MHYSSSAGKVQFSCDIFRADLTASPRVRAGALSGRAVRGRIRSGRVELCRTVYADKRRGIDYNDPRHNRNRRKDRGDCERIIKQEGQLC